MHCNPHLSQITITLNLIDQLCAARPHWTLEQANEVLRSTIVIGSTANPEHKPITQEAAELWQSEAIQSHLPPW